MGTESFPLLISASLAVHRAWT